MVHFPAPAPKKVDPHDPEAQARHRAKLGLGQKLSKTQIERQLRATHQKAKAIIPQTAKRPIKLCSEHDCERKHHGQGLCQKHYMRAYRARQRQRP